MNWAVEVYWGICGILLLYYLLVFSRLLVFKPKQYAPEHLPGVSVVICAKNEAENLLQYLKVVLIQHYPKFEVIVVNDQSDDETAKVVQDYIERNPNLRLINIKKDIEKPLAGKKFPFKVGVEAASYDIIVTTDADCKPLTPRWLRHIAIEFMQETNFVLGYAPFNKTEGFFNKIVRYHNVVDAMKYMAFSLAGMPFSSSGRNLAFRKKAFLEWNGYSTKASKIMAGSDDLFVNANAKKANTEIALNKDAFVYSNAETSWSDWTFQLARQTKTFSHYKIYHQFVLALLALTTLAFYLFPIVFFFFPEQAIFALIAGISVYLIRIYTHIIACNQFNSEDLSLTIILLDLIQVLMIPLLFINTLTTKVDRWK